MERVWVALVWWLTLVIPELWSWRQEDFKAVLNYIAKLRPVWVMRNCVCVCVRTWCVCLFVCLQVCLFLRLT